MNQDEKWTSYWESAGKAIQLGKFDHAEPLLYAALDIAEDFPSDDRRLSHDFRMSGRNSLQTETTQPRQRVWSSA
jgi:hypothetical protein